MINSNLPLFIAALRNARRPPKPPTWMLWAGVKLAIVMLGLAFLLGYIAGSEMVRRLPESSQPPREVRLSDGCQPVPDDPNRRAWACS